MGNGQGVPSFGRSITKTMVDMQEPLKEMTGIDVAELVKSYASRLNGFTNQGTMTITPEIRLEKDKVNEAITDEGIVKDLV